MSRKNVANYSTFNTLLVNRLEIQNTGEGLVLYSNNLGNPLFSFDLSSGIFTVAGTLNVTGTANFNVLNTNESEAGLQSLATTNTSNLIDIGLYGLYNDGSNKYTGIIRDVSDGRWTFFKDITTAPGATVTGIDSTKLDDVRLSSLFVNNGSATVPSITCHNDTGNNTGLYFAAENELSITAGGQKISGIRYISASNTEFELDNATTLKMLKFGTIDDIVSSNPAVNRANIYLSSESGSDKWFKMYSNTTAPTPSYAGVVYTSPSCNYFTLNTGSNLEIVYNSLVSSVASPPDYRNTTSQILVINNTYFESKVGIRVISGSATVPSLSFSTDTNTGIYSNSSDSIGFAANGALQFYVSSTEINTLQPIRLTNGTLAAPPISFTSNTATGLFRDISALQENVTFTANGSNVGKFHLRTTAQFITGASGSAAIPSIAFSNDFSTGLYSPINESTINQLSISTNSMETVRFRPSSGTGSGSIEFYNSVAFTPNGSIQKMILNNQNTTTINTFKSPEIWVQGYNLIDENPVFLYLFRRTGAITKDYSNNGFNATATGSLSTTTANTDTNNVIKRDALNLTSNTNRGLLLTSALTTIQSLDNTSLSFWFRITGALATNNTIFACYNSGTLKEISVKILSDSALYPNAIEVTIQSNALTTLQYHTATSADTGTPNVISVKDNLWHHVVIHFGSGVNSANSKKIMYYDNVELNISNNSIYYTSNGDNNGSPALSTNSFNDLTFTSASIGYLNTSPSATQYFNGHIKDIYLTGKLISQADVNILYTDSYIYSYGIDVTILNVSQLNADTFVSSTSSFANGTAAAPSITFASETNLGIYRAATGTLGLAASGVESLTLTSNLLSLFQGGLQVNNTSRFLRLSYLSGNNGPNLVFSNTALTAQHSIRSLHTTLTADGNYLDFYLYDTGALDGNGFGNNQVMRLGVSSAAANSAIQTIYGITRLGSGSVSEPAFSFNSDTNSGIYSIGADNYGLSAGGILKLQISSVVTVGNASGDTTTKLYVPIGTAALPSIGFIGDNNTGIYSSSGDNIDFATNATNRLNISTGSITSTLAFNVTGNNLFINAISTNSSLGTIATGFRAQTLAARAGGFVMINTDDSNRGFYMGGRYNGGGSINTFCIQSSTTAFASPGTSAPGNELLQLHYDTGEFRVKLGSVTAPIYSFIGDTNTGLYSSNADNLDFATGGVNRLNISTTAFTSTLAFSTINGTSSAPSFNFSNDLTTGIYRVAAGTIGLSSATNLILQVAATAITAFQPLQILSGSIGSPALQFTNSTNTGIYLPTAASLGISTGAQNSWTFNSRGTLPHISLNETQFTPDGTNLRLYVQDARLRASSNQTILNITPILHYKFTNNISSVALQDDSINKYNILASTATYITSTISLTDSNGQGLLQFTSAQFNAATDKIETADNITTLAILSQSNIMVKFKLTSTTSGSLFEIYGNKAGSTTLNFVRVNVLSQNIVLTVTNASNIITAATTSAPLSVNIWYSLILNFTSTGNSMTLNGTSLTLTYSTGTSSTTFNPASFSSIANPVIILGGNTASALGYFAEFYVAPLTTTETATALYRTQAHELYTNKIQLGYGSLIDEGCLIRSDKGNNLVWDNSVQIFSGHVQFNGSKVMRLADGSLSNPSYSFITDKNSGLTLNGTGNISIVAGNTNCINVSSSGISVNVPAQFAAGFLRNITTITGTSATLTSLNNIVLCSYATDASNVTITLPTASSSLGREYIIIKTGNGGGNVIINTASGSEFIDDAVTVSVTLFSLHDRVTLICAQTNRWFTN